MTHFNPKYERWVKPLKRSQKVKLRKELERQKKLGIVKEEIPRLENVIGRQAN